MYFGFLFIYINGFIGKLIYIEFKEYINKIYIKRNIC